MDVFVLVLINQTVAIANKRLFRDSDTLTTSLKGGIDLKIRFATVIFY